MIQPPARAAPPVRLLGAILTVLVVIVLVFFTIRVLTDWPHVLAGTVPEGDFAERYVRHPALAYLHMAPGVVYLLGAPLQLSASFRRRHYTLHRRLGRVLVALALLSGVMALAFGIPYAWGGTPESAAAAVFGSWFLVSLLVAVRAIRRGDVARHRRWMIRAFAVGAGVGTIRIWVGLFTAVHVALADGDGQTLPVRSTFGLAFWLGLTIHVFVGEWWVRRTPDLTG